MRVSTSWREKRCNKNGKKKWRGNEMATVDRDEDTAKGREGAKKIATKKKWRFFINLVTRHALNRFVPQWCSSALVLAQQSTTRSVFRTDFHMTVFVHAKRQGMRMFASEQTNERMSKRVIEWIQGRVINALWPLFHPNYMQMRPNDSKLAFYRKISRLDIQTIVDCRT